MKSPVKTSRAFTLVEVIVVVVVIGILAAVAIPQFANASQEGRVATATMNLKSFRDTLARQMMDTGGQPPATIDPAWFKGGALPENPFDADHPRAVHVHASNPKPTFKIAHEAGGSYHAWWYGKRSGEVYSRVHGFKTDQAALEAYNTINGTKETRLR